MENYFCQPRLETLKKLAKGLRVRVATLKKLIEAEREKHSLQPYPAHKRSRKTLNRIVEGIKSLVERSVFYYSAQDLSDATGLCLNACYKYFYQGSVLAECEVYQLSCVSVIFTKVVDGPRKTHQQITIAVPTYLSIDEVINEFEGKNPKIQVQVVSKLGVEK